MGLNFFLRPYKMTLCALRYYEGEEGEALMLEILSSTKH